MTQSSCPFNNALQVNSRLAALSAEYFLKYLQLQTTFVEEFSKQCGEYYCSTNEKHNANDLLKVNTDFVQRVSERTAHHSQELMTLLAVEVEKGTKLVCDLPANEKHSPMQQTTVQSVSENSATQPKKKKSKHRA